MIYLACPNCHEEALEIQSGAGQDPDTGYVDEDFVQCRACGEAFSFEDLDRMTAHEDDECVLEAA